MNYIDLKDYGEIISTREYIIDKKDKLVATFSYNGTSKETNYTNGNLKISADLYIDNEGINYNTHITHHMKTANKDANINFKSKNIITLDKYVNYMNNIIGKNKSLPAKTYRYDTASIKTEDEYSIEITFGDMDIVIGPFSKDDELLSDGNQLIVSSNGIVKSIYIFYKNGYRVIYSDNGLVNGITNIDFTSNHDTINTVLSNIKRNTSIISNVIDLSLLPSNLEIYKNYISLEYDKFGIVNKSSDNNILYEDCYFEDEKLDTIACIHPLYFDMFDSSLNYNKNLYCQDQLEYEYDNKFARYVRTICNIDNDKIDNLIENIDSGKSAGHPVIKFIDD